MNIIIEEIVGEFSVCKVAGLAEIDFSAPFCFIGKTDAEISLVCPTRYVPTKTLAREDGWRACRIVGQLDFSLVGVLAGISKLLADEKIGIFALSTFDTDYIITKSENFDAALNTLAKGGYEIRRSTEIKNGA